MCFTVAVVVHVFAQEDSIRNGCPASLSTEDYFFMVLLLPALPDLQELGLPTANIPCNAAED
jgi:hypothetical protein